MRAILLALLLVLPAWGAPSKAEILCDQLKHAEWADISQAARQLRELGPEALPALLEAMKDERFVPVENSADLIYPGVKTFYGHGFYVPYPLDFLPARAGWVFENITFQNFGFRGDAPEMTAPGSAGA